MNMIKKALIYTLMNAVFLGLVGLVFGNIAGGLFTDIGIANTIPWTEILTFLGGLSGFILGLVDEE